MTALNKSFGQLIQPDFYVPLKIVFDYSTREMKI